MPLNKYWEERMKLNPNEVLELLREGNKRFINNLSKNKNLLEMVNETADKQYPIAAVLSCSDSRAPIELIFDQSLGDVFSVRLAGNVASTYAIGSLEFSTKYLGTKLIVVLGHTSCGAVKGACDHLSDGNLDYVINRIKPALDLETATAVNRNSQNSNFVENVAVLNVHHQIKQMISESKTIQELLSANKIGIIGGIYNIKTGLVEFLSDNAHNVSAA